jgi:putative permease
MKNYQAFVVTFFIIFIISVCYWQIHILTPFIIAFITAYLLQPLSHWLESKLKIPKAYSALLIISLFVSLVVIISIVIIPFLYEQMSLFVTRLPAYKETITENIIPKLASKINEINPSVAEKVSGYIQGATDKALGETFNILNNIWHYTLSTINFLASTVLVPFVLYYFIRDWTNITNTIEDLVPIAYKPRYKFLTNEINKLLAAYIRGQLNTCLIMALYYSTVLTILQIDFALLIGLLTGFLLIIPFIGFTLSLSISLIVAYFGGYSATMMFYILVCYIIGHALEAYILIPRLVGRSIGLHPVWVVFAILALGNIFGIIGIIAAIPAAGITKILLKFAFGYYKNSELYTISAIK